MRDAPIEHPDEEGLERFLLHQSRGKEVEDLETHILACQSCLTRLESMELRIRNLKIALSAASKNNEQDPIQSLSKSWLTLPPTSWAGVVCAALAIGVAAVTTHDLHRPPYSFLLKNSEVTEGHLFANRGTNSSTFPQGRPLNLHLDTTDIAEDRVTVQVVNATGGEIWRGQIHVGKAGAGVKLPTISEPGEYFLRCYVPGSTAEGQLLREFRFAVK